MNLSYIEIGTSDFNTIVQTSDEPGISIDPLIIYLDRLPMKKSNLKLNVAISNYIGKVNVYYLHPDDISKYNLPAWVRGCNSIMEPHPSIVKLLEEMNIPNIFTIDEVDVITWDKLIRDYNITSVDYLKIDTEGHDHIILRDILDSSTNILPKKIEFESNSLTPEKITEEIIALLIQRGYKVINKTFEDVVVELRPVYPQKIIFSSNDSEYLKFWKHNSEICSKKLKITPVLLHITDEESDFQWDEFGIIKKIKKYKNEVLESQVVRLYSGVFFPDELLMISDIDMFLFDVKFIKNSLKSHEFYDITVIGADAYDISRPECKDFVNGLERFAMCYLIAYGKVFNQIMTIDVHKSFVQFLKDGQFSFGWNSDELIFTDKLLKSKCKINRINRNYKSNFFLSTRIEKYMFQNKMYHVLDIINLKNLDGFIDCHCANYSKHEQSILQIKNLILNL